MAWGTPLSYLVENFFLVILRRRIFFVLPKIFKKKSIYQITRRLIFWPVKIKRFPVKVQGQSQAHRIDLKVPPKESEGSTFDESISNYGSIMS